MKKTFTSLAAASAILVGISSAGFAQTQTKPTNPGNLPPGQVMQDKGSVKGSPGASGYTPGQQMQQSGSVKGSPGASGYAPGHAPAGSGSAAGSTQRR